MASLYEDLAVDEEDPSTKQEAATADPGAGPLSPPAANKGAEESRTSTTETNSAQEGVQQQQKDQAGEFTEQSGEAKGANDGTSNANQEGQGGEKPPAEDEAPRLVFVGGLAWTTTEAGLRMYFEQFGEVKHIDFKRGFAFVHFVSPESVEACCKTAGSEHFIDGRKVEVKISEPHLANKSANFHAHRPDYQQQQQQYPGGGMMGNVPGVGGDEDAANQAHIDDMQSAANLRDAPGLNVGRKVFVGGLNQDVREEDLRKMMEHHGAIEDAIVMIDKFTKRSRGFGFVTFLTREEAENASKQRRQILGGRQCEVKLYEPGAKGQFYHQRAAQMIGPPGAAQPMPYQHHNNNDWSRHRPFNNNFRGGRGGGPYGGPPQHQAPYYAQQVGYGGGGMDYMQQAQGGWGGAGGGYDYSQQQQQQQQQGGWYPPRGGYGGRGGGYQGRGGFQGAPRPNFQQQQQQPPPSQQ